MQPSAFSPPVPHSMQPKPILIGGVPTTLCWAASVLATAISLRLSSAVPQSPASEACASKISSTTELARRTRGQRGGSNRVRDWRASPQSRPAHQWRGDCAEVKYGPRRLPARFTTGRFCFSWRRRRAFGLGNFPNRLGNRLLTINSQDAFCNMYGVRHGCAIGSLGVVFSRGLGAYDRMDFCIRTRRRDLNTGRLSYPFCRHWRAVDLDCASDHSLKGRRSHIRACC